MASIAAFVYFMVVGVRGLGGLRHRYRVAILLKDLRDGVPAGAVGECSMHQNHVTFDNVLVRGDRSQKVGSISEACGRLSSLVASLGYFLTRTAIYRRLRNRALGPHRRSSNQSTSSRLVELTRPCPLTLIVRRSLLASSRGCDSDATRVV